MRSTTRGKRYVAAAPLALGGLGTGAAVAATGTASVANNAVSSVAQTVQNADPGQPMRSDEHQLTGATEQKVAAAVEAEYPNATIQRVEPTPTVSTRHIVTSDGQQQIAQVDKDFTVAGTKDFGAPVGGGVCASLRIVEGFAMRLPGWESRCSRR